MKRKLLIAILFAISLVAHAGEETDLDGQTIVDLTSERASPDRRNILDAARPIAERELNQKVKFIVRTLQTDGHWAIALLVPVTPESKSIDWSGTRFAADNANRKLNGWLEVLLKKEKQKWEVVDFHIGKWNEDNFSIWEHKYPSIPSALLTMAGLATNCNPCD